MTSLQLQLYDLVSFVVCSQFQVKALWKEMTGRAMPTYSKTRWWSKWEIMSQVLVQFGDILPFLQQNPDVSPATHLATRNS